MIETKIEDLARPLRICSLNVGLGNLMTGWLESGGRYYKFAVDDRGGGTWLNETEFEDYSHFEGQVGKFSPDEPFVAEPIEVDDLSFETLTGIKDRFPRIEWPS